MRRHSSTTPASAVPAQMSATLPGSFCCFVVDDRSVSMRAASLYTTSGSRAATCAAGATGGFNRTACLVLQASSCACTSETNNTGLAVRLTSSATSGVTRVAAAIPCFSAMRCSASTICWAVLVAPHTTCVAAGAIAGKGRWAWAAAAPARPWTMHAAALAARHQLRQWGAGAWQDGALSCVARSIRPVKYVTQSRGRLRIQAGSSPVHHPEPGAVPGWQHTSTQPQPALPTSGKAARSTATPLAPSRLCPTSCPSCMAPSSGVSEPLATPCSTSSSCGLAADATPLPAEGGAQG